MKHKIKMFFALGLASALSGTGLIFASAQEPSPTEPLAMNTVLQTAEGYKENGTGQLRTTEILEGEYSVSYSTTGITPGNGWIAQQFIGLDEENTFLQINLFVDQNITVSKMDEGTPVNLPILDAETGEPLESTRSLELGGDWFNGPEYIFKYEITSDRLNLYFGYASKIAEGTDAPVCRAYVELDRETYGEFTDGIAAFAPYGNDRDGYSMTVNSVTVNGKKGNLNMSSMETGADETVVANDIVTIFHPEFFVNLSSTGTDFVKGGSFQKSWVSELPVSTEGLPDAADVFVTSFDINLTTDAGNYIPSGLKFGFLFGMPAKDSSAADSGVTSVSGKLPMAGLDLSVGDGSSAVLKQTIGDASRIFSANDGGMSTISVKFIGKKDGSLTVSYRTNVANDGETVVNFTDINFDGYISFYVEATDTQFAGESVKGTLNFQDIALPSMEIVKAESITLSESAISVRTGESRQLSATVKPDNTTVKTVEWTSSAPEIAAVDENGLVTAISSGNAVITAKTENGLEATCSVLVPVEVSEVILNKTEAAVSVGRTVQLTVSVLPENATDKKVNWTSSDSSIAEVDSDGLVTGVSKGSAVITATTANGKQASCTVTVSVPVETVTLDKSEAELKTGETLSLTATVLPADAGNKSVTWSSDAENVASVENGLVTAKEAGTAVITVVTSDGYKEASCTITVTAPEVLVTEVILDKNSATLEIGETLTLKATIAPENATDKVLSWASSDENIVKVNENGVVTAIKEGSATVTVTAANGKTASCKITVTDKGSGKDEGCGSVLSGAGITCGTVFAGIVTGFSKKRKMKK